MIIDNFTEIENFLKFEEGSYYKFCALIRAKDGDNPLTANKTSNSAKNMCLKEWYIDNSVKYEKHINEMKFLCNTCNARLYLVLDRKSIDRTLKELAVKYFDMVTETNDFNISTIIKQSSKISSMAKTSNRPSILFDVDIKDINVVEIVKEELIKSGRIPTTLKTVSGYHIIALREGWTSLLDVENKISEELEKSSLRELLNFEDLIPRPNQMGLIYFNKKD